MERDPSYKEELMEHVKESVGYISSQLYRSGDVAGALRCALLLRYFFKNDTSGLTHDPLLHGKINTMIKGEQNYLFRGVDSLNALIDQSLTGGGNDGGVDTAG